MQVKMPTRLSAQIFLFLAQYVLVGIFRTILVCVELMRTWRVFNLACVPCVCLGKKCLVIMMIKTWGENLF